MGLDPQDNQSALADLHAFLARAYPTAMDAFAPVEHELAVADSQTWVFGDSRVNGPARGFLESLVSHAEYDAPLLARLHDSALVRAGLAAATQLLQFSDFNAGTSDPWTHSRDWVMASNLLSAMAAQPEGRAIFWAHNAHIAAPDDPAPGGQPMGSRLRAALGCRYGALAVTFDHGDFVAQIPNDLEDDLAVNTLPPTPDEAIEGVLRTITKGPLLSTWNCEPKAMEVPAWLQTPRRMHWVGALFRPGTDPNTAFRTFRLLDDFDGIVFIPGVTADEMPTDRPLIPARRPE
jgi:erythromycin esterase-like protein